MSRTKKLSKDIVLFAIASFGPKLISFFLVPLYTSSLSTDAYGVADLLNTVGALLLPVLTLDISDAIMLFTIEYKKENKEENIPLVYGMDICKKSSLALFVFLFIICMVKNSTSTTINCVYILLYYCLNAIYNNFLAYMRGMEQVSNIVTASLLNSSVTILANIVFILVFKWGVYGLLSATILGILITDIYISLKLKIFSIYKERYSISLVEKKEMLRYSFPLIFTGLAWWLNSSSDRLFISVLSGVSINGIYAVANKIPSILSVCHNIIYQAMQLSVFSEIDAEDRDTYLCKMYRLYNFLMVLVCFIIIALDKCIASILFKGEFFIAWRYSPALLISVALFSAAGYMTTIASALKETKIIAKATILGAIINTVLNIILIKPFELYGAVIATLVGYFFIWLTIVLFTERQMGVKFGVVKSSMMYLLLIAQWMTLLFGQNNFFCHVIILLILLILNKNALEDLWGISRNILMKYKR